MDLLKTGGGFNRPPNQGDFLTPKEEELWGVFTKLLLENIKIIIK